MKLALVALLAGGCMVGGADGSGAGDDQPGPDGGTTSAACPMPTSMADVGSLTALHSAKCNVPMSMGAKNWYRLSAELPGSPMDVVQIELWDGIGAFAAGKVAVGTYAITGLESAYDTCGVCVRGLGDKGSAGAKKYFATGGSVTITSLTPTLTASFSNVTFGEVDAMDKPVASGACSSMVGGASISGTLVDSTNVGGGGGTGGGNGGGTGGAGGGACPTTIGD
jgi:hypothetical protein